MREWSLAALYSRYSRAVFRRARRLLGDADAAKDVTQEVFLRLLRSETVDTFAASPMAWLYRATTNLCLNRLRDSKRRGEILAGWRASEAGEGGAEARVALRRILERVPEELQDIAVYYYVDELSHDEIAAIVGVSRRTVGNRLSAFHERVNEFLTTEAAS